MQILNPPQAGVASNNAEQKQPVSEALQPGAPMPTVSPPAAAAPDVFETPRAAIDIPPQPAKLKDAVLWVWQGVEEGWFSRKSPAVLTPEQAVEMRKMLVIAAQKLPQEAAEMVGDLQQAVADGRLAFKPGKVGAGQDNGHLALFAPALKELQKTPAAEP